MSVHASTEQAHTRLQLQEWQQVCLVPHGIDAQMCTLSLEVPVCNQTAHTHTQIYILQMSPLLSAAVCPHVAA